MAMPAAAGEPNGADPSVRSSPSAAGPAEPASEAEEDDGLKPLSERLITELTAHRTLALRDALANEPRRGLRRRVLHALCLGAFYRMSSAHLPGDLRQERELQRAGAGARRQRLGQGDRGPPQRWVRQLPKDEVELWDALVAFDATAKRRCSHIALRSASMPCMSRGTGSPRRLAHADTLARAVNLDMVAAGWSPTVDNYLGRVPKARILEAVREAKGEAVRPAHRPSEEAGHGEGGGAALDGYGLAARAVAHARRVGSADGCRSCPEPLPAFLVDGEEDSADDQAPSDPEEAPSSAVAAE